ncbi:hypothetical protein DPMN_037799 [Dreissena polymorpha]|uniref:Uncharacterized protein n=1 Tax=Dreissena polymorpha TaxID=45954 RepID=A0A9D4MDE1_DREPO|nr:hypothetical protein DPMN_037799 [Dreissena polymorpha]
MNLLGYGPEIRHKRIEERNKSDMLFNAYQRVYVEPLFITAGSKAEGLTCRYENDTDLIFVMPNTLLLEDGVHESTIPDHINVLKMNMQSCSAGYCRPLLVRLAPSMPYALVNAFCYDGYGSFLLSSTYLVEQIENEARVSYLPYTVFNARAGPSLPWSHGAQKTDFVGAIRCNCLVI